MVQKIEALQPSQGLLIQGSIIPGGYGSYPLFEDPLNFMKRGRLVNLYEPSSLQEAVHDRLRPTRLRIDRFDALNSEREYCGYSWAGLRHGQKRVVHLDDVMLGLQLFSFSDNSRKKEDKITLRTYDDHRRAPQIGGAFTFSVPSMSREDLAYVVRLSGVPLPGYQTEYAVWMDLQSNHGCEKKVNAMTYRFALDPEVFCPHDVAAYMTLAKQFFRESKRVMLMPFALPTEKTVSFWRKLREQVMVQEQKVINGKIRNIKRPLNFADREILLWKLIAAYGNKATLFARRRIQDYEWK